MLFYMPMIFLTLDNPEEELKKFKKGEKVKVKVLEIKKDQQKVRVGLKQTQK